MFNCGFPKYFTGVDGVVFSNLLLTPYGSRTGLARITETRIAEKLISSPYCRKCLLYSCPYGRMFIFYTMTFSNIIKRPGPCSKYDNPHFIEYIYSFIIKVKYKKLKLTVITIMLKIVRIISD